MDVRGKRLTLDEFMNTELSVKHHPEMEYNWATGVAITKFLKGLKNGKILGTYCNDCDRTVC
ncbi:MAG: DNA-binding protein, partial [Candidatus Heimdallarchaeota archaeon]|nr:DNA-binding protein [Candidatus Heimdallarchaeota archaeon]